MSKREFMSCPSVKVDTKYGPLSYNFFDKCVTVRCLGNYNSHPEHAFVVRGVQYNASADIYLWSDGQWHIGKETDSAWEQTRALSVWRINFASAKSMDNVSDSARKAIAQEFMACLEKLITEQPDLLRQGALADISNDIRSLQKDREEALAKLADLEARIAALEARERSI
jgi:hypothetical protein